MLKKILLVDDEPDIVLTVKMFLEGSGFSVVTASDGSQGYESAKSELPDLIILDLMLPKMDGYKVCRMLKFDDKYKHIPVILFTARAQETDVKLGKDVGADAYLTKPFEPDELLNTIKRLLPSS